MFRSPSGRKSAGRVGVALRSALVVSLFVVAATLPFINTKGAGQQQEEESQPRAKSGLVDKGKGNVIAGAEFVPGEVLVRFRTDAAAKSAEAAPASLRPEIGGDDVTFQRFEGSDIVRGLSLAKVEAARTLEAVAELASRPDVLYAEPNYIWRVKRTPNDPRFGEMYGLNRINAPAAWDRTIGRRSIVVGVLDGGVDINHPDLQANIWTNPGDPVDGNDNDGNGFVDDLHGWDFHNNNSSIFDNEAGDDHATHVAGTIGATGDNNVGVTGVNWEVSLMSLKVLGPTGGSVSRIINGYNYARLMRQRWDSSGGTQGANIRVLNNSYGGPGRSLAALDAIQQLNAAGILFVVAAGNDGSDNFSFPHFPSNYDVPNVLAVASTNSSDSLSSFSNFSSRLVSLGAPGSSILSTTPNNTYSVFSGTSMATPHVAGAAALVCAARPDISLSQLRGVLAYTGDVTTILPDRTTTGRRLNVFNAIQSAQENDTTRPAPAGNMRIIAQNGRGVTLNWTAPGDDGNAGQAADYDFFFINPATGSRLLLPTNVMPVAGGTSQGGTVYLPFLNFSGTIQLRAYDNAGNHSDSNIAVTIPVNPSSDPYTVTTSGAQPLSTDTTTNLFPAGGDDKYASYSLPFSLPFYGQFRGPLTVSTNGVLYFATPLPPRRDNGDADDAVSSIEGLQGQTMIAGLWDDIDINPAVRPDSGVFVSQPGSGRIIFRWQGVTFATPRGQVNFEIELRSDGTIITRYGENTNLYPVVGISGGEPNAYVVDSHTRDAGLQAAPPISLTNAQTVTFSVRPAAATAFSLNGQVTGGGPGVSGVTVILSGLQTVTTMTDASGNYSFVNLPAGGNYTVTPVNTPVYSFTSQSVTNLSNNQTLSFAGTLRTYAVSGRVSASSGSSSGLAGVSVTLSGGQSATTTTDAQGNYFFASLPAGRSYTVTSARANYTFAPPSATFNLNANQTANFAATLNTYTISGQVTLNGAGLSGVTVTLSGSQTASSVTASSGFYSFNVLAEGTYMVTSSLTHYTFTSIDQTVINLSGNQTTNFAGTLNRHNISGRVVDAGGSLAGVAVTLTAGGSQAGATMTSDAQGNYSFLNLSAGETYTITPSKPNHTFNPLNRTLTSLSSDQTGNFSSGLVTYTLSGRVAAANNGLAGVTVRLSGSETGVTATDQNGNYAFTGVVAGGNYTVTPSLTHFTFTAPSQTFNNLSASQSADFLGARNVYTLSGRVTEGNAGLAGVTVALLGSQAGAAITDAQGNYSFGNLPAGGIYTLRPSRANYDFNSSSRTFTNLSGNQTENFTASRVPATVQFSASGYQFSEGDGLATIVVTRSGDTSGIVTLDYQTTDSDTFTVGCFDAVNNGGGAFARCDFATIIGTLSFAAGEQSKTINVPIIDDAHVEGAETFQLRLSNAAGAGATLGGQNVATVTITNNDAGGAANPVVASIPFFVRLQYLDFLAREPEAGEPWTAVMNRCANVNTGPTITTDCDRIAVSGAFFGSPEFQLKGSYVFRFYRLAFNRLPQYTEFLSDTSFVAGATEAEVYARRAQLATAFAARQEFTNAYGGMTNAQYVAALLGRYQLTSVTTPDPATPDSVTRITLSDADLTNGLNAGTLTRAQVLRAIADSDRVATAEYNSAFVAVQYYGYLRRTPEPVGYQQNLTALQAGTSPREMINAFLNSAEYRLRFGQP